jgi:hypothetical protein
MRSIHRLALLAAVTLAGCHRDPTAGLPWSDAAAWQGSAQADRAWEWILASEAVPNPPPALAWLGIDGFDNDAAIVAAAHQRGARVWCYLSVGTAESYRPDYAQFLALDEAERAAGREAVVGAVYPEWPDERWLNPRRMDAFMPLIEARLDMCASKGFDAVELDNMDGFDNETGFAITRAEELAYVRAIAAAARDRGLRVIHKVAVDLVPDLVGDLDAILLEDCVLYDQCAAAAPYAAAGKPVWNVEYPEAWRDEGRDFALDDVCAAAGAAGTNTLIKRLDLDADTIACLLRE